MKELDPNYCPKCRHHTSDHFRDRPSECKGHIAKWELAEDGYYRDNGQKCECDLTNTEVYYNGKLLLEKKVG